MKNIETSEDFSGIQRESLTCAQKIINDVDAMRDSSEKNASKETYLELYKYAKPDFKSRGTSLKHFSAWCESISNHERDNHIQN